MHVEIKSLTSEKISNGKKSQVSSSEFEKQREIIQY